MKRTAEEMELEVKKYEARSKPVSMRQARLKLLELGMLDNVNTILQGDPSMAIEWEYATELKRDNSLVVAIGIQLGLTDEQLDDMFISAREL